MFGETDTAKDILKKRYYASGGSSPEQLLHRVANAVASVEDDNGAWSQVFFDVMHTGKFLPNSPCLVQAGLGGGLFGCFVLGMEDNLSSITKAKADAMAITKAGGGWGIPLGNLRPRGSKVAGSTHGIAGGPLGFLETFSYDMRTMTQGGFRDAACMATMPVDHPDIYEFIRAKSPVNSVKRLLNLDSSRMSNGRDVDEVAHKLLADPVVREAAETYLANFNISVIIPDGFIESADPSNAALLREIAEGMHKNGEPGIIFIDAVRRRTKYNPDDIQATNPCLPGDIRLHTQYGLVKIEDLYKTSSPIIATVDNRTLGGGIGVCTRPAGRAFKTFDSADVFLVRTFQGYEIKATAWHEFYTARGKIALRNLVVGDKILIQSGEGQFGALGNYDLGEMLGFFVGDGWFSGKDANLGFWGHKKKIAENILTTVLSMTVGTSVNNREYGLSIVDIPKRDTWSISSVLLARQLRDIGVVPETKLSVPEIVWQGTRECVRGFIRGLFFADGHIEYTSKKRTVQIVLSSSERQLLVDVQRLLSNFGIFSAVYLTRPGGVRPMPDGHGAYKEYHSKPNYRLIVTGSSREIFMSEIGMISEKYKKRYRDLYGTDRVSRKRQRFMARITEITPVGTTVVYDVTQPDHNSVIFNGMVTGQCSEQPLPPNGSCCLGSINLAAHIKDGCLDQESLAETIEIGVRFLDNMITLNKFPTIETREWSLENRSIGLGIMGWADTLVELGIRYDSDEAIELANEVGAFLNEKAYAASNKLLMEKGGLPYGSTLSVRRNRALLSIAPTGTISLLADCSAGIEPIFRREIVREDLTGTHTMLHKLASKPEFVTVDQIDPKWIIRHVAAFSHYVDSSISYTVNIGNEATVVDVIDLIYFAWRLGCNGITVYRDGSRSFQVLNPVAADGGEGDAWDRPHTLSGTTYKYTGEIGSGDKANVYVTINDNNGAPMEIFLQTPHIKSMSLLQLVTLATRLTSLCLRHGVSVWEVIKQLRKVEGQSLFSVPALMARALLEHTGHAEKCSECGGEIVHTAGCNVCLSCGYSSCG